MHFYTESSRLHCSFRSHSVFGRILSIDVSRQPCAGRLLGCSWPWVAPSVLHSDFRVQVCHLLHCLPGRLSEKAAVAFGHARAVLAPGGVLFGATILGKGVEFSLPARSTVAIANRLGVLSNLDDDRNGLDSALAASFSDYEVEIVGTVALFTARIGGS